MASMRLQAAKVQAFWGYLTAEIRDGACQPPSNRGKPQVDMSQGRYADEFPIRGVEYEDFQSYLDWIKQKTGKVYRLPNNVEWEYWHGRGLRPNILGVTNRATAMRW